MTLLSPESVSAMQTKPVTFLIVDDDEISVIAVRRAIKKLKIINPVRTAKDGQHALDILRGDSRQEKCARPFLVLLDINMPRMDGFEFLETIRKDPDLKHAVVFILSTSDTPQDVTAAYQKNVAGYIVKDDLGDSFLRALDMIETYTKVVELPDKAHPDTDNYT